ncbi:GspH/FimT family pseudopilin [Marinospirillum sp.]|uniref:GspH/FimT family pseudopilin n=1 Tax=Marinospirillum sp. TaxID=2183934 RepID=UPI002870A958|nr:GspH/FimT family pseudopilin [Marinospirillum sp.]MDR9468851.1 GspH/FimT family pseudopilin [Marinospirillum sp.]
MPQQPPDKPPYQQAGFNLLELLVVLAIAGVMFGIAIPAGQGLLEKSRLIGATNEVYATLMFARNEATRRRDTFSLCAVSSAGSTDCSTSSESFLAVFEKEGTDLAIGRTNPLELTSPARVSLNNLDDNRLVFERLGNRKAGVDGDQPVSLEVSVNSLKRTIDVCFNGRIMVRKQGSSQSGCEL